MINETNVRCFLVLAETLNFTETANRVFLTQQAVSKNIRNLESSLGFILFDRSSRNVTLTNEGIKCLEVFRGIEKIYSQMIFDLRAGYAEYTSSLYVGYQKYLELGPNLRNASATMQKDFPNMHLAEVRHSPEELYTLLLQEKLDLIVVNNRFLPKNSDCNTLELMRLPIVLLISREDPRITPESTWQDFKSDPFLVDQFVSESPHDLDQRIDWEVNTYGLTPSRIVILPNRDSAYSAAIFGRGILLDSEFSRLVKDERLLSLKTESTDGLSCVWKKDTQKTTVLQYVEYLKRAFSHT